MEKQKKSIKTAKECERRASEQHSWEEFVSIGTELVYQKDKCQIQLGLLALSVEKHYGTDAIGKFAVDIRIRKTTLEYYRWTVSMLLEKLPRANFLDDIGHLGFSHLKIIAGTDNPQEWIDKAINEDLTCEQLVLQVKKLKTVSNEKQVKIKSTVKAQVIKLLMDYFPIEPVDRLDRLAVEIDLLYSAGGLK